MLSACPSITSNNSSKRIILRGETPNPTNLPILVENKYKTSDGYSGNFYNISSGMVNGVLYPALDPSIFEVKYPNSDIQGKVFGDNLGTQG